MSLIKKTLLVIFITNISSLGLIIPPPIPSIWPSEDQTKLIEGDLLKIPLVTDALAYVNSIVPANILAIKPSTYISLSNVTYNSDPIANCYWPGNLCVRSTDSAYYKSDLTTCPTANDWGLTFDDGPTINTSGNDTPALVTALGTLNVKATFFIVGSNAIQFPAQLNASIAAGHHLGSHTWTHHPLTSLTNAQIVAEIKYTEAKIYQITGLVTSYFRPPYGNKLNLYKAMLMIGNI